MFDYAGGKLDWLACGLETEGPGAAEPRAGAFAQKDVLTCVIQDEAADVRRRMEAAGRQSCVVLDGWSVVLGRVQFGDLQTERGGTVENHIDPGPSTFRPNVPLTEMLHYMHEHKMEDALITTSDGVLIGNLSRQEAEAGLTIQPTSRAGRIRRRRDRD